MSMDPKTIGEEILGAEIVAGKELTEAAGGAFEAMERSAAIWLQQARWLFEDYGQFFRDSVTKPGDPRSLFSLIESRSSTSPPASISSVSWSRTNACRP